MPSYKVERCHHIKANGARCGSPALRKHRLCYFHHYHPPIEVGVWETDMEHSGEIVLPVIEDASSILVVVRKVTELLLSRMIQPKAAGLILYGLQIASSNLKRLDAEKLQPEDTVIDPQTTETSREIEESGEAESDPRGFLLPNLRDMDPEERKALLKAVDEYHFMEIHFEEGPNTPPDIQPDIKACVEPLHRIRPLTRRIRRIQ